jgi:hypothetical protein
VLSKQLLLLFTTDTFEYSITYINYLTLGLNIRTLFDLFASHKLDIIYCVISCPINSNSALARCIEFEMRNAFRRIIYIIPGKVKLSP